MASIRWITAALLLVGCCVPAAAQDIMVIAQNNVFTQSSVTPSETFLTFFGETPAGTTRQHTWRIYNPDLVTSLTVGTLSIDNVVDYSLTAPATPFVVAPGGTISFDVTFQPSAPGNFGATLTLNSNAPGGRNALFFFMGGNCENVVLPDITAALAKPLKPKLNKTTNLLDVTAKLRLSNAGTTETVPHLYVYRTSTDLLPLPPGQPLLSLPLQKMAAAKNGKPKKRNLNVKITGLPDAPGFLFFDVSHETNVDRNPPDNWVHGDYPAVPL